MLGLKVSPLEIGLLAALLRVLWVGLHVSVCARFCSSLDDIVVLMCSFALSTLTI